MRWSSWLTSSRTRPSKSAWASCSASALAPCHSQHQRRQHALRQQDLHQPAQLCLDIGHVRLTWDLQLV
jgi:hypothetical protein